MVPIVCEIECLSSQGAGLVVWLAAFNDFRRADEGREMALNISAWSIRHPLPPLILGAAIVTLGYINFTKLPITRMPNVDVPIVNVAITQFGASPAELEIASHKEGRGCGCRCSRLASHAVSDHGWDFDYSHQISPRG